CAAGPPFLLLRDHLPDLVARCRVTSYGAGSSTYMLQQRLDKQMREQPATPLTYPNRPPLVPALRQLLTYLVAEIDKRLIVVKKTVSAMHGARACSATATGSTLPPSP